MNGNKTKPSLIMPPKPLDGGKDAVLKRMAPLPDKATHVGIANVDTLGLTVMVAGDDLPPHVFRPDTKTWVPLSASRPKIPGLKNP